MSDTVFTTDSLWQFANDFYQKEGVEPLCLALQDEFHLNVNVSLFAIWYALTTRRILSKDDFRSLMSAIAVSDQKVVEFRSFRRKFLAQYNDTSASEFIALKQSFLSLELQLEKQVMADLVNFCRTSILPLAQSHLSIPNDDNHSRLAALKSADATTIHFLAGENLENYFAAAIEQIPPALLTLHQQLLSRLTQQAIAQQAA